MAPKGQMGLKDQKSQMVTQMGRTGSDGSIRQQAHMLAQMDPIT